MQVLLPRIGISVSEVKPQVEPLFRVQTHFTKLIISRVNRRPVKSPPEISWVGFFSPKISSYGS